MLSQGETKVQSDYIIVQACRVCGEKNLQPVISFGAMPLSNAFLNSPSEPDELYPLDVVFCPNCALVQLSETIEPTKLFSHYNYFSSVSREMVEHAERLAEETIDKRSLGSKSLVMEIASNDGYLLQHFKNRGIPVLGIDPAENIAKVAQENGIETVVDFFGRDMAGKLPQADVVFALNVLGHVSDVTGFIEGIAKVLKPNGVAIIEVPYVREMVESCDASTIYFEHLYYWNVTALCNSFKWHGLQVVKVERIPIHCGSLRVYVTHQDPFPVDDRRGLNQLLGEERLLGIDRPYYYNNYASTVKYALQTIHRVLGECRKDGQRIVGFGAAAKGTMLLNQLHAGIELIDRVVDETPAKQGKFIPGVKVPIVSPGEMGQVDAALLLAWNWKHEFKSKFPQLGGRWIIPFPQLRQE